MEMKSLFPCKILTRNYDNKGTPCPESLLANTALLLHTLHAKLLSDNVF